MKGFNSSRNLFLAEIAKHQLQSINYVKLQYNWKQVDSSQSKYF